MRAIFARTVQNMQADISSYTTFNNTEIKIHSCPVIQVESFQKSSMGDYFAFLNPQVTFHNSISEERNA